jgi:hypothetical protein
MPPVFGRDFPNPHLYDAALASWLSSIEPDIRAMARNLMHDHRVSAEREKVFDSFVKSPATSGDLQRAIVDYFNAKVRTRTLPEYVYRDPNGNNLLTGRGSIQPIIHKDVKLVRVLDLNRLRLVYQWANDSRNKKRAWRRSLTNFPLAPNDDEIGKWLDDEIGGGSEADIEEMVATVLDAVSTYSQEKPFQPTWATTWAAFEPHQRLGPDRWTQSLGIASPPPRWIILLKYTVAEAGTLVRPTILDAGWYAYHFPSPPIPLPAAIPYLSSGGYSMDLRIRPRANHLIPEYIHKQIKHPLKHWFDAGTNTAIRTGRTTAPNLESLVDQRNTHHELLASVYGTGIRIWMYKSV